MTQQLTLEEVKRNARNWYNLKMLTAQHPDPNARECRNRGHDGYRCAVGASFNEETLNATPAGSVYYVQGKGLIGFESEAEMWEVSRIQDLHDNWARNGHTDKYFEQKFLEAIAT